MADAERRGDLRTRGRAALRHPARARAAARPSRDRAPGRAAGAARPDAARRRSTRRTSPRPWPSGPGIPVTRLLEGEVQKLVQMEERLRQRVVGQDEAIHAVSNAVRRGALGPQRSRTGPIGSFLFLGPTGVGKTELARALAEFLFDDERAMIRIDMSEYMEKHTVARLIGAPPGYVGYDEGGQLTEAVRRRPVLGGAVRRDREGAPRRVQRAAAAARRRPPHRRPGPHGGLPQHGRHHDLEPRAATCSASTSEPEKLRPLLMQELRKHAPAGVPEPHRRDRDLPAARPRGDRARSSTSSSRTCGKRLADKRITLELTDAAKALLAEEGYDPTYGARPLKRTIQRLVQDPLALKLLERRVRGGRHRRGGRRAATRWFPQGGRRGGAELEDPRHCCSRANRRLRAPIGSLNRPPPVSPSKDHDEPPSPPCLDRARRRDGLPAGLDRPARDLRRLHQADRSRDRLVARRAVHRGRASRCCSSAPSVPSRAGWPIAGARGASSCRRSPCSGSGAIAMALRAQPVAALRHRRHPHGARRGRRGAEHGLLRRRAVVRHASGHGDRLRRRRHVGRPADRHPARQLDRRSARAGACSALWLGAGPARGGAPAGGLVHAEHARGARLAAVRRHRSGADRRAGRRRSRRPAGSRSARPRRRCPSGC